MVLPRSWSRGTLLFKFFFFLNCVNFCSSNGKESKPLRELGADGPSPANEEEPLRELGAYGPSPGDEEKKPLGASGRIKRQNSLIINKKHKKNNFLK